MSEAESKRAIERALPAFAARPRKTAASGLFIALGYARLENPRPETERPRRFLRDIRPRWPVQPQVPVAVELKPERAPRGHAQIAQPQLLVDEAKVVVQALARVGLEKGSAAGLVVPRFIAVAGLHRRDHVHQPRMIAPTRQHFRHHPLFANVGLVDVLYLNTCFGTDFLGACPNAITQRLSKARVVKNADLSRIQKLVIPAA